MQGNSLLSDSLSRTSTTQTAPSLWRTLTFITFLLLQVQFFIGMLVNLYIQVPAVHPGANSADYFSGVVQGVGWALTSSPPALLIHVSLGLLLCLASLALLGFAIASRRLAWIISSTLGLIGVIGAGFNGASFLNYGHDFSSLLMSTGFLLATISYMLGFAFAAKRAK
jgi:hypothetical protein